MMRSLENRASITSAEVILFSVDFFAAKANINETIKAKRVIKFSVANVIILIVLFLVDDSVVA